MQCDIAKARDHNETADTRKTPVINRGFFIRPVIADTREILRAVCNTGGKTCLRRFGAGKIATNKRGPAEYERNPQNRSIRMTANTSIKTVKNEKPAPTKSDPLRIKTGLKAGSMKPDPTKPYVRI